MRKTRNRGRLTAVCACAAALAISLTASASADVQTRVVGGGPASIANYPWQAAVRYDATRFGGSDYSEQFCGGVVVAPRIVLTAAHCVYDTDPDFLGGQLDPDDADVVINEQTLSTGSGEHHDLQATYVQPGYNPSANSFDVGYLVLSSPTGMQPIKLAGPTETALWPPGSPTQVSGYGTTIATSGGQIGSGSNYLKAATVPIVPDSSCGSPSVYGSDFIASSMVCAGSLAGGDDACFGDSGGPLQAPAQGGIFRLVGLVSWGDGCAQANAPGVYARVGAGAPGTLEQAVVNQVSAIETSQGLPHTDIVGSGALPPGAAVPSTQKKCKKGQKLKRIKKTGKKKCVKKRKRRR